MHHKTHEYYSHYNFAYPCKSINMLKSDNNITPYSQEDLSKALATIRQGGIICYPTDTIWGIGCDARNSEAVKRVYEIKKRADHKALITLVGNLSMLERIVSGIPEEAYSLIEFSHRPTTIIYDHGKNVAPKLLGPDGTLGVRLTRELFSNQLCNRAGVPIVSTSANISGKPSPASFKDIDDEILSAVDYVCLYRQNESVKASPSVIMRLSESGCFKIIRS